MLTVVEILGGWREEVVNTIKQIGRLLELGNALASPLQTPHTIYFNDYIPLKGKCKHVVGPSPT